MQNMSADGTSQRAVDQLKSPSAVTRHSSYTHGRVQNARVLVPLYIFPLPNAWEPLYKVIQENPGHEFVIVLNPNSGPEGGLTKQDYLREIPRLNNFRNVQTIGYIKIDYGRRPLSETFEDIETYASWLDLTHRPGIFVEGLFVDETPNHFSEERSQYLNAVRKYARAVEGFGRRRLIIENPGTPPDHELVQETSPDVIVTCEEPYNKYVGDDVQRRLAEYHYSQARSAYMISAIPLDDVSRVVRELRRRGAYIFATDLVDDFYESFGKSWDDFVAGLHKL